MHVIGSGKPVAAHPTIQLLMAEWSNDKQSSKFAVELSVIWTL